MKRATYGLLCLTLFLIFPLNTEGQIKRVRLNYHAPNNLNRELLLGFTPNNEATDGYDYGYDGQVAEFLPNDLNWLIEDQRCVIQGVGVFNNTKKYPFGLYQEADGTSSISLIGLENFEEDIDVFIYDDLLNEYHQINTESFNLNLNPGEYLNRFYIAFSTNPDSSESLSVNDIQQEPVSISYNRARRSLTIYNLENGNALESIELYDLLGKVIFKQSVFSNHEIKLSLSAINHQIVIALVKTKNGTLSKKILI